MNMPTKCPKCDHECIENEVALICPNCDYLSMKKIEWKGDKTKCPKCNSMARVYKHQAPGKSFICDNCNTIGRYIDEKKFNTKIILKDTPTGKKLCWLFEVPCEIWKKRDTLQDTVCSKCDMRKVCEAHSEEIHKFCHKKGVEIYLHQHFIEVLHK